MQGREIREPECDVLDRRLEIDGALAIGKAGVDLAGLGVHQERLQAVTVATQERVGQRTVTPEDAGPVQLHEKRGHGIKQSVAIAAGDEWHASEEASVLEREAKVVGGEDGHVLGQPFGHADDAHRGQAERLHLTKHVVLAARHGGWLLLERDGGVADDDEAHEVPGWSDRQASECQRPHRPIGQGRRPGQGEQVGGRAAPRRCSGWS